MLYETIRLWDEHPEAELISYVPDMTEELALPPRKTVIVFPGGGYHFLSDREAEPIAFQFMAAGFNAFILRYSVGKQITPWAPQIEAALAVKYVRENAKKFNVDPSGIFVCGFSAGGHLAASISTLWNAPEVTSHLGGAPEGIDRPDGSILCYPVITLVHGKHKGSFVNLTGQPEPTPESIGRFALQNSVDKKTPPAFLWHTFTDATVPVECSLLYADALTKHGIPFEMHIFPEGRHGLSLSTEFVNKGRKEGCVPHVQCWIDLACRWVEDFETKPYEPGV